MESCWTQLPDNLLLAIFQYLPPRSLLNSSQTCSSWLRLARDELLWKDLFHRHYKAPRNIGLAPGKVSWQCEFRRLEYCAPSVESEVLREHRDQVLHVSFAHQGHLFATTSKDGFVKVWRCEYPCTVKFFENMRSYTWKYTQYSQFNNDDSLLLVSGVHFGSSSTSGEIAVFSITDDHFELQCRVLNKPYDIFGAWFNNGYLLSGRLHLRENFSSSSELWLNKASQACESEHESVIARLYQFINVNASSMRTIMIARCVDSDQNQHVCHDVDCGGVRGGEEIQEIPGGEGWQGKRGISKVTRHVAVSTIRRERDCSDDNATIRYDENYRLAEGETLHRRRDDNNEDNMPDDACMLNDVCMSNDSCCAPSSNQIKTSSMHDSPTDNSSVSDATIGYDQLADDQSTDEEGEDWGAGEECCVRRGRGGRDVDGRKNSWGRGTDIFGETISPLPDRSPLPTPSPRTGRSPLPSQFSPLPTTYSPCLSPVSPHLGSIRLCRTEAGSRQRNEAGKDLDQDLDADNYDNESACISSDRGNIGEPQPSSSSSSQSMTLDRRAVVNFLLPSGDIECHDLDVVNTLADIFCRHPVEGSIGHAAVPIIADSMLGPSALQNCRTSTESENVPSRNSEGNPSSWNAVSRTSEDRNSERNFDAAGNSDEDSLNFEHDSFTQNAEMPDFQRLTYVNRRTDSDRRKTREEVDDDNDDEDKYLIYTTGEKTYTPHQIGIKRITSTEARSHIARLKARRKERLLPGTGGIGDVVTDEGVRREEAVLGEDEAVGGGWVGDEVVWGGEGIVGGAEGGELWDVDPPAAAGGGGVGGQGNVKYDAADHVIELNGHIIGMCLSPDHRYLYVNSRSWPVDCKIEDPLTPPPISSEIDIHIIDLRTKMEVGNLLRSHKAFTPNDDCFFIFLDVSDEYVASGAEDKHGYMWDRHYGICLRKFSHSDVVNSVAFNPRDAQTLVTVSDDHTIKIWRSLERQLEVVGHVEPQMKGQGEVKGEGEDVEEKSERVATGKVGSGGGFCGVDEGGDGTAV